MVERGHMISASSSSFSLRFCASDWLELGQEEEAKEADKRLKSVKFPNVDSNSTSEYSDMCKRKLNFLE